MCGGLVVLFRHGWTRPSRARRAVLHGSVMLVALVAGLLAAELALGRWYIASDGGNQYTRAGQRWHRRYWRLNRYGYRDVRRRPADFAGKRVVVVLGDSFVAGYGVRDVRDRFSNLLGERLGEGWVVVNLARCGWDTAAELQALRTFEPQPDFVVWFYYLNDIEGAAVRCGSGPAGERMPTGWSGWLIERSNVVNLAYWSLRDHFRGGVLGGYWDWLHAAYADPCTWGKHRADIAAVIEHCTSNGIGLEAVVWPHLTNLAGSAAPVEQVERVLAAHDVPYLDVLERVQGRAPGSLVVGRRDSHPNAALNHELFQWMWPRLAARLCGGEDAPCAAPADGAASAGE